MTREEIDLYYYRKTAKRDQQMVPIARFLAILVLIMILALLLG
jgi:hypothetical protein